MPLASAPSRLPLHRRLLFVSVIVLGELCLLEGGSWAALRWIEGQWRGPAKMSALREDLLGRGLGKDIPLQGRAARTPESLVHPFQGYVKNPAHLGRDSWESRGLSVNEYGFVDSGNPLDPRVEGEARIAITGGSVAGQLLYMGTEALEAELWSGGYFPGSDSLRFVNLASGGYKQPQQAQTLQYLLALGASFDAVINLDGFNEVALWEAGNAKKGVHPAFPRGWFFQATGSSSSATQPLIQRISALSKGRKVLARELQASLWRRSGLVNLLWSTQDRRMAEELGETQRDLVALVVPPKQVPFAARGPTAAFDSRQDSSLLMAQIWQRSSRSMHQLCAANDIAYFHFLQPNQYIAPSKPMDEAERKVALNEGHPYRAGALRGYPLLQQLGAELAAEGVAFQDLTGLFQDVQEPLYSDDCCHFNAQGCARLGRAIAARMLAEAVR